MLTSDQENLVLPKNVHYEVMPSLQLRLELHRAIYGGIDLAPENFLGRRERRHHLRKSHISDHHQVHVTARPFLVPCYRAVNEGRTDSFSKRRQSCPQVVASSCGLGN